MIINPYAYGFDPLSIGWHTSFWAEGPEFQALGLSDGGQVSTWPDESSTNDATQATAGLRPLYRASTAALGNRPTVEGDSTDDYLRTASFTALSQPNTIVVVARMNAVTTNFEHFVDGLSASTRHAIFAFSNSSWAIESGLEPVGGTQDALGHLFVATFNGASSGLEQDGSAVISGDAGAESLTGLNLFGRFDGSSPMNGHIAFLGLKDGTLTTQEKADLLGWSRSHYGTP